MNESWFCLAGLLGIKPTLVANAYFVITFLSISVGLDLASLSMESRFDAKFFVGVEGADWNFD
jgi:hypothetical protein